MSARIIGIVGGIGPESTVDYYRKFIAKYRESDPGHAYPAIVINSIDVARVLDMMGGADLDGLTDYLVSAVDRLADAGAAIGLIAANTPHIVFDRVEARSRIPLVSIVAATCAHARARGMRTVGIFGTRFTMAGTFYPRVFSESGISIVPPSPEEQEFIHNAYVGELVNGIFRPETRQRLLGIVEAQAKRAAIDAVILGGTELPLILKEPSHNGLPLLDTTAIHVDAVLSALSSAPGKRPAGQGSADG